jgi:hypothetical protein
MNLIIMFIIAWLAGFISRGIFHNWWEKYKEWDLNQQEKHRY